MGVLFTYPKFKVEFGGQPIRGGKLYAYIANTTTPKDTYSDESCSTANANPVVLDANGEAVIYTESGVYDFVLKNSDGTKTYWTIEDYRPGSSISRYKYFVDPSEADHGTTGSGASLYDIVDGIGTSLLATIVLQHTGASNNTDYTVSTTWDASAYTNITLEFENGARLKDDTNNASFTWGGKISALPTQQIFDWGNGTGSLNLGYLLYSGWFGTIADGSTDSRDAFFEFFDAMIPYCRAIIPPGEYVLNSGIDFDVPSHSTIEAYGAELDFTTDTAGIDFNTSDRAEVLKAHWLGGKFLNSSGAKTTSTALEWRDFRNVKIADAHFQGFFKAVLIADRDTYLMDNCHFFDNSYSIYIDTALSPTSISSICNNITNCHFSINGEIAGVYVTGKWFDTHIVNCSFNGAVTNSAIYFDNTGVTSDNRNLVISGNHFEQGDASTKYVYVKDVVTDNVFGVEISNNNFTYAPPDAVVFENVRGAHFSGNVFAQTTGNGTPIDLDANCQGIRIDESNRFSTGTIVFACSRDQITFGREFTRIDHDTITSYNGDSFSTSNATIDMSTAVSSNFPTIAGIVPKGWVINIQARDSGSAASTTARVDLDDDNAGTSQNRAMLSLKGVPNDAIVGGQFFVPCDSNGDIWINIVASGADTLDVWLAVVGYYM